MYMLTLYVAYPAEAGGYGSLYIHVYLVGEVFSHHGWWCDLWTYRPETYASFLFASLLFSSLLFLSVLCFVQVGFVHQDIQRSSISLVRLYELDMMI